VYIKWYRGVCSTVIFSHKKKSNFVYNYNFSNNLIQRVNLVSDLSIYFEIKLNFNIYVHKIKNKASSKLGLNNV